MNPIKALTHTACTLAVACSLTIATTSAAVESSIVAKVTNHTELKETEKSFIQSELIPLMSAETLINACVSQNNSGMTLDHIKAIDTEWKAAEEPLDIMMEKLTNECANFLADFASTHPQVIEIFVMDQQGANVGQSELTSDFWQGDESKFTNSYALGSGGIDVGGVELDESTNQVLRQVSLPIIKNDSVVVGAITFGLDVSNFK